MAQKQNGDPVGGKAFLSTSKGSEASQVRHLHVCVIFLLLRHCSSGICSWSPNGQPALQPVGLATFEGDQDSVLVHTALTLQQFLTTKTWLWPWPPVFLICLIWSLLNVSCFQKIADIGVFFPGCP